MNKIKEFIIDKKEIAITFAIIIIVLMIPYFKENVLVGVDFEYHYTRIESMAEDLKEGIFPVKVHSNMARGYGYGTGFFYPNFFLYIPAIIYILGVNFLTTYKLFMIIMLIMMFVFTYISFKTILEDKVAVLIGTAIYMLSNCLTLHMNQRGAVGEFSGMVFIPLIVAGMYDYTKNDFKKPYLLGLGFFGVINSHLITALLCTCYAVVTFLINIKSTIENKSKFLKLVICAILVAMLTACFWMPMLEQMVLNEYKYSDPWIEVENSKFGIVDLFALDENCFGLLITISLPLIIYGLIDKKVPKKIKGYIIEFIVFVVIMISPWFWHIAKVILWMIQFKWRLLGLATAIAAIVIAALLKEYSDRKKIDLRIILGIVLLLLIIFFNVQNQNLIYLDKANALGKINGIWKSLGGGTEYLPLHLNIYDIAFPECVLGKDFQKIPYYRENGIMYFTLNDSNQDKVYPPLIYYYGYVADITDENGNSYPLEVRKSDKELVEVVTEGKTGNIRVWYNGTKVQKISYLITLAGLGLLVGYTSYRLIKKKVREK